MGKSFSLVAAMLILTVSCAGVMTVPAAGHVEGVKVTHKAPAKVTQPTPLPPMPTPPPGPFNPSNPAWQEYLIQLAQYTGLSQPLQIELQMLMTSINQQWTLVATLMQQLYQEMYAIAHGITLAS